MRNERGHGGKVLGRIKQCPGSYLNDKRDTNRLGPQSPPLSYPQHADLSLMAQFKYLETSCSSVYDCLFIKP